MDYYLLEDNCYQRLENEFKKYGKLIFCVDFDDTIYDFHKVGRTYNDIISLLHRWEEYSEVIILTGAGEERYPEIEKYLSENNIKYKGINCDSSIHTGGRKTYANVYIDDRGGLPLVYKMLDKLITKIESDMLYKLNIDDMVKLFASCDAKLSDNTIILPNKIYSKYIKNKNNVILARNPVISYSNILKIDDLDILESSSMAEDYCLVSSNIALYLNMDIDNYGDILCLYQYE